MKVIRISSIGSIIVDQVELIKQSVAVAM